MSQDQPDRTIGGLQRRGAETDLSRLRRVNRPNPAAQSSPPPTATPAADPPATEPELPAATAPAGPSGSRAAQSRPAGASTRAGERVGEAKDRVTVYLDARTRGEARAAYRATAHLEGDRSWSDFVARAIAAEVERRQALHNDGRPYGHDAAPLNPGRPMLE